MDARERREKKKEKIKPEPVSQTKAEPESNAYEQANDFFKNHCQR